MIIQFKQISILPFKYIWFCRKPKFTFSTIYLRSLHEEFNFLLIKKQEFYTKEIDLTKSMKEIKAAFSKTTKNEINRAAKRDNIVITVEADYEKAIKFYNEFARSKNLPTITLKHVMFKNPENLLIIKAVQQDSKAVSYTHLTLPTTPYV